MEYAISKKPFAKLQIQQSISYNINNDGIEKSENPKKPNKHQNINYMDLGLKSNFKYISRKSKIK